MAWTWIKSIGGIVCVLIGLVWIGQGTNLLPGSIMSGQVTWLVIGLAVLVFGAWVLWSVVRDRRSLRTTH